MTLLDVPETYHRWDPVEGLPEASLSGFELIYRPSGVSVSCWYYADQPIESVHIVFDGMHAFKVYNEFSDPWLAHKPSLPELVDGTATWPFQLVHNSHWIMRVVERNGGLSIGDWRHFVICTKSDQLHVMTLWWDPRNVRVTGKSGLAAG
jgi:hypothetical protein